MKISVNVKPALSTTLVIYDILCDLQLKQRRGFSFPPLSSIQDTANSLFLHGERHQFERTSCLFLFIISLQGETVMGAVRRSRLGDSSGVGPWERVGSLSASF